jgi:hypothetical protein
MSKPVIYWCAAAVLAVGVVLMHVLANQWLPLRFPELQKPITEPIQLGPGLKLLLATYLVMSVVGAVGVVLLAGEGVFIRDQQRWAAEWEAQRRLSAMEERIREERLPEAERERRRRYREEQAEVRREARRRLGLPEEEPPHDR